MLAIERLEIPAYADLVAPLTRHFLRRGSVALARIEFRPSPCP